MTRGSIEAVALAGRSKQDFSKDYTGRFFCRAIMAGFFIVIGTIICIFCGAYCAPESFAAAKLISSLTFSFALILIVFVGGELFTGSNFVMGISIYERTVNTLGVLRVWLLCYIGNLAGILILCTLINISGANADLLVTQVENCLPGKISAAWYQLLIRGALCNFLVCVGVFAGFRLKSECGKALIIALAIATFVLAGFEHSIANMAYFSLAVLLIPGTSVGPLLYNLLWVTLGNIIGGAVLLGLPVWLSAEPKK